MAAVLIIGPIFEADLLPQPYGSVRDWTPRWLSDGSTGT
jgi:hypothetical protein